MDIYFLSIISLVFLIAGIVKGVIGLGLPTVSLALLTVLLDLPQAMILMIVPSLVTNVWQAISGESTIDLIKLHWQFFFSATLAIFVGAQILVSTAVIWLPAILGLLLCFYSVLGLTAKKLHLDKNTQAWTGSIFGLWNGILTGMTGSFVVPGVLYLQSIGMQRDRLIQSMGILFTLSTIALSISLLSMGIQSSELSLHSTFAVVPALLGMWGGKKIRKAISEQAFRILFYISLIGVGLLLILKTIF